MFLKHSDVKGNDGKVYRYYKIVESVREDKTVRHKQLFKLGALSDEKAEQIRKILAVVSSPEQALVRLEDVLVEEHIDFLDIYIFILLWKEWSLETVFDENSFVQRLVINRCLSPRSKIGAVDWNQGCVLDHITPPKENKFGVYPDLDHITLNEESLQKHIAKKIIELGYDTLDAIVYDITSTYFDQSECVLAFRGYSRDHRSDKLQIVIALAVTPNGYPFYWRVYKGNTQDISTVTGFVDDVKRKFGIDKCLLVFDRGMVSGDNIEYVEDALYKYITAIDKNEIAGIGIESYPAFDQIDESNIDHILKDYTSYDKSLRYREYVINNKRYILGFDLDRRNDERSCREEKIAKFTEGIQKLNDELSDASRSRELEKVKSKVNYRIKRNKLSKIFTASYEEIKVTKGKKTVRSYRIDLSFNAEEYMKAGAMDGVTCFFTNTDATIVPANMVILQYRQKNIIEESFQDLKSQIKLRPIRLSRPIRVRAHVTICVLAYLLMNTFYERIKKIKDLPGMDDLFDELNKCKINILGVKDGSQKNASITKMTDLQTKVLKALGYESIAKSKEIKGILKKLKKM